MPTITESSNGLNESFNVEYSNEILYSDAGDIREDSNCSGDSENDYSNLKFQEIALDFPWYETDELIEITDCVFLGKVKDISFAMLYDGTDRILYTVYQIEVVMSYKGETIETVQVAIPGGRTDAYLKQQAEVVGNDIIYLMTGYPTLYLRNSFLFMLNRSEDGMYRLSTGPQGTFMPSETEFKEVISAFGEDKWAYYEQNKDTLLSKNYCVLNTNNIVSVASEKKEYENQNYTCEAWDANKMAKHFGFDLNTIDIGYESDGNNSFEVILDAEGNIVDDTAVYTFGNGKVEITVSDIVKPNDVVYQLDGDLYSEFYVYGEVVTRRTCIIATDGEGVYLTNSALFAHSSYFKVKICDCNNEDEFGEVILKLLEAKM